MIPIPRAENRATLNDPRGSLLSLYASVFVASVGIGMYNYFIPVYAQALGANFLDLGLIGTTNAIGYAVTPALVGILADRLNRAWIFTVGLAFNALSAAITFLAATPIEVAAIRLFGGFAFAFFWPTAEILVSDLTPVEARVREIGRYSVAWSSGILIGPAIGGAVLETFGFTVLFVSSGIVTAFGVAPALFRLIPGYRRQEVVLPKISASMLAGRKLIPWYVTAVAYGAVFSAVIAIFPGYANNLGIPPTAIGLLFTMFGVARVFAFAASGRLQRYGEVRVFYLASLGLSVSVAVLGLSVLYPNFALGMVVMGASFGTIFPLQITIISRAFPKERLGLAIGSYETTFGVGFTIGPIVAGAIADATTAGIAFVVTSLFGLTMIGGAFAGRRNAG